MRGAMISRAGRDQLDHEKPNTEQVFKFLKDNRAKAFMLDIETDSTIMIDENGEKERRGEFMQVLAGMLPQLSPIGRRHAGEGGVLRRSCSSSPAAPFRAGRRSTGVDRSARSN